MYLCAVNDSLRYDTFHHDTFHYDNDNIIIMQDKQTSDYGLFRVATAIPTVKVADVEYNLKQHIELIHQAHAEGVQLLAFPELSITGYTCADLFHHTPLLESAKSALMHLAEATKGIDMAVVVGAPLALGNRLYNCGILLGDGVIAGIVPKIYLPNYNEFYEARWFASGDEVTDGSMIEFAMTDRKGKRIQQRVRMGKDLLFDFEGTTLGIEICEDLWVPMAPSNRMALAGAQVIVNLSCSDEVLGKHAYLRRMIEAQSGRLICAYVYTSAGFGESSTDLVFAGKGLIAENGTLLGESERFQMEPHLLIRDVDIEKLKILRQTQSTFVDKLQKPSASTYHSEYYSHELPRVGGYQLIQLSKLTAPDFEKKLYRFVAPRPFVPSSDDDMESRCSEIFNIQVQGLVTRLNHIQAKTAVIGISGGLDSTLALLVTVRAFDKLGWDRSRIVGITMPGFGTSGRTYKNSIGLMKALGITLREISIKEAVNQHFKDLGVDSSIHDITYENCQARERTQILMDASNQTGGIVIGTGDLSELCLGWCTYNGDHMSMYAVNVSIPKTLVKYLVKYVALHGDEAARPFLLDVIDTPISPELIPTDEKGNIAQKTEDLVGPYELHDFFLYHMFRFGASPDKIFMLAKKAFQEEQYASMREGTYDDETIQKWLRTFCRRFFQQQFKRSCLPDGPKVGTVSISPRGDWRMPSDASAKLWV